MLHRTTMVDKIENKQEQLKASPKVDIEVKNPKIAKAIDKEFSQYIENKDEWKKTIESLHGESKKLNKDITEKIEKQFEEQVSSGEIVKVMQNLEKEIGQKGYEEVRRNRGVGLIIPMQLMLREIGYDLAVDGFDGDETKRIMKDFKEKNNISLNAPSPYSVDFFKTLREKYIGRYSEKDAAKRLTERIAKKELTPEEKKALENTRYRSFLTEYFVNTLARPAIADVLPTKEDRGAFYGLVPTDGNDILRADGVKSVAYGPNIRRNDDKSWLDLSNFDLEKNSKINLVAHTNNGYETSFTVDVKDITYINPNKELKINLVNLYKKTSSAISKGYLKNRMSA